MKRIMNITILFFFIVLLSIMSTAVNQIRLECLTNGESIDFGYTEFTCHSTVCMLCIKDTDLGSYIINLNDCSIDGLSCEGGNISQDLTPPEVTFISPTENQVFGIDDVPVSLAFSEPVKLLKRTLDNGMLRTVSLSGDHTTASFTITNVEDGYHILEIRAYDYNNNMEPYFVHFYVDTMPPEIISTTPANGYFIERGPVDFKIKYNENFIVSLKLFYKSTTEQSYHLRTMSCQNGEDVECIATVDLSSYPELSQIQYYFELQDSFDTISSGATFKIDTATAEQPILITNPGNNAILNSKSIQLTVLPNMPMTSIKRSLNGGTWSTMCSSNCNAQVTKSVTLVDKQENEISVEGTDQLGNKYYHTIRVIVDATAPKIKDENPGRNDEYATSSFWIKYDEYFPSSVSISFREAGTSGAFNEVSRTDCPAGINKECTLNAILTSYEGKTIEYFYSIRDIAGTVKSSSQHYTGKVDTTPSVMNVFAPVDYYISPSKYIGINIGLNEEAKLEYYADTDPRWRNLCNNCDGYDGTKSFKEGANTIIFRATDGAGNTAQQSTLVYVDTKIPKLYKILDSGDYVNSMFPVKYEEYNPVMTKLFVKKTGAAAYSQFTSYECVPGKNIVCYITATSPSWNNGDTVEAYFEMYDIIGNMAATTPVTVTIDTVVPVIDSAQILEVGSMRKLSIDTDANYKITYILDGGIEKPVCTSCGQEGYEKSISCTSGAHTLVAKVTDLAGNVAQRTLTFTK
ncbi:MAG: hypothetical protein V1659_01360 [Candidatus Woesearchaeota archaeon]